MASPFLHSHSVLCGSSRICFAINAGKIDEAIVMPKLINAMKLGQSNTKVLTFLFAWQYLTLHIIFSCYQ